MFRASLWLSLCLSALVSATPSRTVRRRADTSSPFVSVVDGGFQANGSAFKFVGTNAPWISTLNADADVDATFDSLVKTGVKVVRTWAFNDVPEIPEKGTWFQLIANGSATINFGVNGLQKLDKVVQSAERHGVLLQLSLTNNWNPLPLLDNVTNAGLPARRDVTKGTNNTLPRNTLSNDYGGMDAYVRAFGKTHDEFYTNDKIIEIFKNYTSTIVSRYASSPAIFSWELANDPRCNSTVRASDTCTTATITKWHDIIAKHIKTIDKNHLISSGNQGFFCVDCPKLFPRVTAPPPGTSQVPGSSRRRSVPAPLTKARLLKERTEQRKRTREIKLRETGQKEKAGIRIRGQWASTPAIRQEANGVGTAFDGSSGVDSEDILNIPEIGFGTFSLYPDQEQYGPDDANLSPFNNTVAQGLNWIKRHAEAGRAFGKPVSLTGFGLVTQPNAPKFVPFNSTIAPFANDTTGSFGVTPEQQADAYKQWLDASITGGLQGVLQYQWGQGNLTTGTGTSITTTGQNADQTTTTGQSPSDGYSTLGIGQDTTQQIISDASAQIGNTV